jgi:hypothetical protein
MTPVIGGKGNKMRVEQVEIYSDQTNRAVLRHPGRHFPGILIQGDNLYSLCQRADLICLETKETVDDGTYQDIDWLRNALWSYLAHYKTVLNEHGISMPFSEQPLDAKRPYRLNSTTSISDS